MTLSPTFWASIAQANPVGPAPITRISVRNSAGGLALAFARVSMSSATRNSGMESGVGSSRRRGFESNSETVDSSMYSLGGHPPLSFRPREELALSAVGRRSTQKHKNRVHENGGA